MERHDMMNRAARSVLGAGTFAAAMLAIGVGHASATTTACDDENALVCGHVYTETNGTPTFQVGEGTTEVVTVVLVDAGGNPVESATPSNPTTTSCNDGPGNGGCAYYSFNAPPGDYKVCILLSSGEKTACQPVSTQFVDIPFDSGGENSVPPDTEAPYNVYGSGTGTPGYWKNHPEAWPTGGIEIGGITYANNASVHPNIWDAIKLMGKVSGDKTYSMFAALISAKLNTMPTLQNNYDCVQGTIANADAWMTAHPAGSGIKASSATWQDAADLWHQKLDDYNNGKLCAPHRD